MFLLRDSVTPWPVLVKNGLEMDTGRSGRSCAAVR
jgi:hypothetical protein